MILQAALYISLGGYILQTATAAIGSMSKPKRDTGAYAYWYRFLRKFSSLADDAYEQKFGGHLPRVVDETATTHSVTTPEGQVVESAVSSTTTTVPIPKL